ncbi:MAG TPA: glutaredoxin family protein [Noviherbaspirillum sp.]|jgi:glutaredoxin|uniref:glutaredoxin family protein n=1 Tax=Noviherbaspirillum sp. TaxID=1926288 RepID=UPI002DDCAFA7|nr:glutaredoxin family protein [Noviherbaspirillum sp.]HEV2611504.1 glutaredoxin family protein [Noviherbaspirillum sp.]
MNIFRNTPCVLLFVLFLIPAAASGQTLYKSVGPDGRISYSDTPPAGAKVQKTMSYSPLPASPVPESVRRDRQEPEAGIQRRSLETGTGSEGIRLFTATWCGYCTKAKAYLGQRGLAYQEYDIDTPAGKRAFAQAGTGTGIPLLLWKERRQQGFSKAGYDALFENLDRQTK